MPSLTSSPPATIEECQSIGKQFGEAWPTWSHADFEEALIERLTAIDELAPLSSDAEEAMAAFDQAARSAWESAQHEEDGGRR
jgi:hypothetical protein